MSKTADASGGDTDKPQCPELEAEKFLDARITETSLNKLLHPNIPVIETERKEGYGPHETGFHPLMGYDDTVLEEICKKVRELEDGFGTNAELFDEYTSTQYRKGLYIWKEYEEECEARGIEDPGEPVAFKQLKTIREEVMTEDHSDRIYEQMGD